MPLWQKYLRVILQIVPAGTVGASLLLGSTLPSAASDRAADVRPSVSDEAQVSARLAAIREAVFAVGQSESVGNLADKNLHLAWGRRWGNWGRRRRGWRRPWNNWWRNW
jgi:hypothetical protein